jgi:hypothetical protein
LKSFAICLKCLDWFSDRERNYELFVQFVNDCRIIGGVLKGVSPLNGEGPARFSRRAYKLTGST